MLRLGGEGRISRHARCIYFYFHKATFFSVVLPWRLSEVLPPRMCFIENLRVRLVDSMLKEFQRLCQCYSHVAVLGLPVFSRGRRELPRTIQPIYTVALFSRAATGKSFIFHPVDRFCCLLQSPTRALGICDENGTYSIDSPNPY